MADEPSRRSEDTKLTLLTWVVGLMACVMMSAIPWAFSIQVEVARMTASVINIEKTFDKMEFPPKWFVEHVKTIEERVKKLEDQRDRTPPKP